MSDGLAIQHRRITKPCFRTCSSYATRSQAPLCLYARCPIADRAEGTFGLLRYLLGGDRPSQTAHLALSAARVHGTGLELKHNKGGVSSTAPPVPGYRVYSLPPTLRMLGLSPILSCIKVHGVFPSSCGYVASSQQLQFHRAARGDSDPVVTPFMQVGTYPTRNFATLGPS